MRLALLAVFLVVTAALLFVPSTFAGGLGRLDVHSERPVFFQRTEALSANAVTSVIPGYYRLGKAQAFSSSFRYAAQNVDRSHPAKNNGSASIRQSIIDGHEVGIVAKNLSADFIFGLIPSLKRPWGHRFFLSLLSQGGNPLKTNPKRGKTISFNVKLVEF